MAGEAFLRLPYDILPETELFDRSCFDLFVVSRRRVSGTGTGTRLTLRYLGEGGGRRRGRWCHGSGKAGLRRSGEQEQGTPERQDAQARLPH